MVPFFQNRFSNTSDCDIKKIAQLTFSLQETFKKRINSYLNMWEFKVQGTLYLNYFGCQEYTFV